MAAKRTRTKTPTPAPAPPTIERVVRSAIERDRSVLRTLSTRRDQFVRQNGGEDAA